MLVAEGRLHLESATRELRGYGFSKEILTLAQLFLHFARKYSCISPRLLCCCRVRRSRVGRWFRTPRTAVFKIDGDLQRYSATKEECRREIVFPRTIGVAKRLKLFEGKKPRFRDAAVRHF